MKFREKVFLPYQERWLQDRSRFKIVEKSRRVGFTYVQAYEDTVDAARSTDAMDVWFSSADETAAKEYINYCGGWARLLDIGAKDFGESLIDKEEDLKSFWINFASGKRITALSSSPKNFRSKGGKLVLDEFAFHRDPEAMWKAAAPIVTWGYPIRILSTYNGKGNRYYRMVQNAKNGRGKHKFEVHTVTIEDAVRDGLVDKILGRKATDAERAAFIEECREIAGDEETYLQEYMCEPVDEATAWLTWEMIGACQHGKAGKPIFYEGGDCYVGMDIARRRHLTVIWVIERVGDVLWTREVIALKNASFKAQDDELDRVMSSYRVRRVCMDQTGIGEKPVEDAKRRHGAYRVEGVLFTPAAKHHLANLGKEAFEDRTARIPESRQISESHHAVRKLITAAGNPRFDAEASEVGHADEFWAHMLALHAAEETNQPPAGATVEHDGGAYDRRPGRQPGAPLNWGGLPGGPRRWV
ncbi:MAG: terminase large subunit domain-containing protein [Alphaproteobacteria bacterium]